MDEKYFLPNDKIVVDTTKLIKFSQKLMEFVDTIFIDDQICYRLIYEFPEKSYSIPQGWYSGIDVYKRQIHGNLDFRYIFLEKTDILTNRKDVRYVSFFRLLKLFLLLKNNDRVILHSYSHPFLRCV